MKIKKIIKDYSKSNFYEIVKKIVRLMVSKIEDISQLKWLRTIKIQEKLMISFLVLSFIPLAVTSVISYRNSSYAIETKIETYSVQVMKEVSRQLETELTHMERLCEELAMTEEIQRGLPNYEAYSKIRKFQIEDDITLKFVEKMRLSTSNTSSHITSINIINDKGIIMGAGQNNYKSEQLLETVNTAKDEAGKYNYKIIKDLNGNFEVLLYKIVKNHVNGTKIGTLILTFKEAYISNICKQLNIGDNAEVLIINSKGEIVSSSNPAKIPINKEYEEKMLIEKILKSKGKNIYSFPMNINGEEHLVAYYSVENCDWFIISTIPYLYLQAESKILMRNIILIGLICLLFAIPISFLISFSISIPLRKLKKLMKEVRKGKLDVEVIDNNSDELAEITKSFDDMIFSIRMLVKENIETQKEIVYKLGHVTEARSQETGNHIRRVAHYSKLIALKYGMPKEEAEILKMASTLHDIGKVAIPDEILLKPGKLTQEEFELMKTHTIVGHEILSSSNKRILKVASIIALQHHEKYDGTGYPKGLSRDEIEIYSKIVALTDVFDALGTERIYKKKWELDEIVEYIRAQSGKQFDPKIVRIFLDNLDEFKRIQNDLRD